jgi:hypothetical protein
MINTCQRGYVLSKIKKEIFHLNIDWEKSSWEYFGYNICGVKIVFANGETELFQF